MDLVNTYYFNFFILLWTINSKKSLNPCNQIDSLMAALLFYQNICDPKIISKQEISKCLTSRNFLRHQMRSIMNM